MTQNRESLYEKKLSSLYSPEKCPSVKSSIRWLEAPRTTESRLRKHIATHESWWAGQVPSAAAGVRSRGAHKCSALFTAPPSVFPGRSGEKGCARSALCRRGCAGHTHFFDPGARGTILKGLRVLAHGVLTSWSLLSPPMTPPILLCTLRSETVRQRENQGRWADPGMRSSSVPQSTDSLFKKGKSDG